MNYTIITSQCKGPKYPPKKCCSAFKEFACPYADQLNDLRNDCATTMFSYINLYGKYPPGLFANSCQEKGGLKCPGQKWSPALVKPGGPSLPIFNNVLLISSFINFLQKKRRRCRLLKILLINSYFILSFTNVSNSIKLHRPKEQTT